MKNDGKTMSERLNDFLDSDEGKESIIKWQEEQKRETEHYERWVEKCIRLIEPLESLDELFIKYKKHSEKRRDILYHQGYDSDTSLADIVLGTFAKLGNVPSMEDVEYSMFTANIYHYKNYIAELCVGQGSFIAIYKK